VAACRSLLRTSGSTVYMHKSLYRPLSRGSTLMYLQLIRGGMAGTQMHAPNRSVIP
jgi:hypothetical protein